MPLHCCWGTRDGVVILINKMYALLKENNLDRGRVNISVLIRHALHLKSMIAS